MFKFAGLTNQQTREMRTMRTRTKVTLASIALAATIGTVAYTKNSVDIRTALMDNIYMSLPAEVQDSYVEDKFNQQDYGLQSGLIKSFVDEGVMPIEDKVYVGVNSLMQLPEPERAASMYNIMDQSGYDITREVTFYGLPQLNQEDASVVLMNSGKTLWSNFTDKVKETYNDLFNK
jgi:hypothetical protein